MSEDVSRRKTLALLGAAMGLALALTEDEAEAETAGMERRQQRRTGRNQRRTGRPATASAEAPAGTAPAGFKPTVSPTEFEFYRGLKPCDNCR